MTSRARSSGERLRIVGIADTDSYLKWGATLLGGVGESADVSFLVLRTPLVVSARQERDAIHDSGIRDVRRIGYDELEAVLGELRPDAVLLAARGPLVRVLARVVARLAPAPVIVTGLPGISVPATRKALFFRAQCDLFIVHSRRERDGFRALAEDFSPAPRLALSRLPFAVAPATAPQGGSDLVFAAQALVPRSRADRLVLAGILRDAALADPDRRVVLKVRGRAGEQQTHAEADPLPDLVAELGEVPANLVIDAGPMARALERAEGLVTVSSTAAIEAIARGVPVIALDEFGVSDELINTVFEGSGLLADRAAVVERRYGAPGQGWLRDNYFHDASEDDWLDRLESLVVLRRAGRLPLRRVAVGAGGAVREAWDRRIALGRDDPSLTGALAWMVGMPLRALVRLRRRAMPGGVDRSARVASSPGAGWQPAEERGWTA